MTSMTSYYGRMKHGLGGIDSKEMVQLGEDYLVVAATGAGIGLMSAALGGLDKKILNFPVPMDGLLSIGLGIAGLEAKGETGKILKLASIAAGGSAAVRTFEGFFKRALNVKGEFEDLGGGYGGMGFGGHLKPYGQIPLVGPGVGFGAGQQDRLVEAAKYL